MLEERQLGQVLGAGHTTPAIIVNATFLGVAWFAVLLRCYTRIFLVRVFYLEDWLMVFATMLFTVYCSCVIKQSEIINVGESHILSLGRTVAATRLLLISETFYIWTVLVLKLSVGLFYLRLSVERWQKGVVWGLMALSTSYSIALFFMQVFQCGVPNDMILFVVKKATGDGCLSGHFIESITYAHAAITAFTDWVLVFLPIFILKNSSMVLKEKIVVGLLMAFASIGGVASLIRFKYVPGIAVTQETFFTSVTDIAIWSCIEPGIGIVAGCFICLRPLFKKPAAAARSAFGYMSSSLGKKNSGYVNELSSTSQSNLRDPIDWPNHQYRGEIEDAYEMSSHTANWPFTNNEAKAADHPEKVLHTVLDTRHIPRRPSEASVPMAGVNSAKPTPTRTREAWIDSDNDSR